VSHKIGADTRDLHGPVLAALDDQDDRSLAPAATVFTGPHTCVKV